MIRLDLQPETEAQLAAEAEARRLALDQYIEKIVESRSTGPDLLRHLNEAEFSRISSKDSAR